MTATTPTASEQIRAARRSQLLADFERDGYPLAFVRMLLADVTLHAALDTWAALPKEA